jgi:hypothetical protein
LVYGKFVGWCVHSGLNCPICLDDSDAFRLEHNNKVTFFDCRQKFFPLNLPFSSDRWLKQKLRVDIMEMLDDLEKSKNDVFEDYSENHNWTKKSCANSIQI